MTYWTRIYREEDYYLAWVPDLENITQSPVTKGMQGIESMAADMIAALLAGESAFPIPSKKAEAMALRNERAPYEPDEQEGACWRRVAPALNVLVAWELKRLREAKGWSMLQAADALGIKPATYQKWESHKRCNPTLDTLQRLGSVLGLEVIVGYGPAATQLPTGHPSIPPKRPGRPAISRAERARALVGG